MSKGMAVLSLLTVAAVTFGQPALAGGLRCAITDPEGDAFWELSSNVAAQPYRDIAQVEVAKAGRSVFTFAMDMAGEVPDHPTFLLPSVSQMLWWWLIDTDPATAPRGFPLPPGFAVESEFIVQVVWDGQSFTGQVIDRRPLLSRGQAVVTPASFKISKTTLSVSVDAESLGNPASFRWSGLTLDNLRDRFGADAFSPIDFTLASDAIQGCGSGGSVTELDVANTSSGSATRPDIEHRMDAALGPVPIVSCDGFDVIFSRTGWFDIAVFFDRGGALVRIISVGNIDQSFTNSSTGFTLSGPTHGPDIERFGADGSDVVAVLGLIAQIRDPDGTGVLLIDAGQVILSFHADGSYTETESHGKTALFDSGLQKLCELLR